MIMIGIVVIIILLVLLLLHYYYCIIIIDLNSIYSTRLSRSPRLFTRPSIFIIIISCRWFLRYTDNKMSYDFIYLIVHIDLDIIQVFLQLRTQQMENVSRMNPCCCLKLTATSPPTSLHT